MLSPGRMLTSSGEKPFAVIMTVVETVRSPDAADATHANASRATSGSNMRFMVKTDPLVIDRTTMRHARTNRCKTDSGPLLQIAYPACWRERMPGTSFKI
jgi:hypothetical protein